jgi:hypothetical protein
MRSGNHQNVFADEELIMQNLRHGAERNALVEQVFQFDVAARKRVADDNQIGPRSQVRLGKRLGDGMPNDSRNVDMGGYDAASEPVTRKPRSCSMPASEAIAVPQMPMR